MFAQCCKLEKHQHRELPIFNVAKFFTPCHYYEKIEDRDSPIVYADKCLDEMNEIGCTLYKSYPKMHLF